MLEIPVGNFRFTSSHSISEKQSPCTHISHKKQQNYNKFVAFKLCQFLLSHLHSVCLNFLSSWVKILTQACIKDLNATSVFYKMPYFGHQVPIRVQRTQPTLLSKLPFQLGSRGSQSIVEQLKQSKDLKFDSNNYSVSDVFPPFLLSNIYAMQTPVTQLL